MLLSRFNCQFLLLLYRGSIFWQILIQRECGAGKGENLDGIFSFSQNHTPNEEGEKRNGEFIEFIISVEKWNLLYK